MELVEVNPWSVSCYTVRSTKTNVNCDPKRWENSVALSHPETFNRAVNPALIKTHTWLSLHNRTNTSGCFLESLVAWIQNAFLIYGVIQKARLRTSTTEWGYLSSHGDKTAGWTTWEWKFDSWQEQKILFLNFWSFKFFWNMTLHYTFGA